VTAAVAAGARVTVLPGPSAVTAALAVSGLPCDRFCFEGFVPRRAGERARRLAELAGQPRTMVFFESPRRLEVTLNALAGAFGAQRRAVACRELTKTHEEIRRGTLAELAAWAAAGVRGEVTLVVAGAAAAGARPAGPASRAGQAGQSGAGQAGAGQAGPAGPQDLTGAVGEVAARVAAGASRRDAITAVAAERGLRPRALYDAVVRGGHSPR
jgi:16S rRNA (cytidine1402-2'-O)-methyltransferase